MGGFIPALLSTLISVLGFIYQHSEKEHQRGDAGFCSRDGGHGAFNTPFLNLFWYNSPVPDVDKSLFSGANLMFIIIYILIFVGLALQASGLRRSSSSAKGLENQMITEQAKGSEGHTRQQLEARITLPHHTIFCVLPLYILPIVIAVIAWFVIRLLGQLAGAA